MSISPGTGDAQSILSAITSLLSGRTSRAREADILAALRNAPPPDLDSVIQTLDLHRLISDIDDRIFGPDNQAALFHLLSEERLSDLSVTARARLVSALQRGRTSAADERAIAAIFLGTRGPALTCLKNAVDGGSGDYHDLQQLIFHDIDDGAIREAILHHIRAEAEPRQDLKILSDIDDTLYRNWKDERYPKRPDPSSGKPYLYPGVRAFYVELDILFGGGEPSDLTFLTARPGDRAGVGEGITRGHLSDLGFSYAKVTTGSLDGLLTHERMAERKYEGFRELRSLYPEYRFVFCGDSGQGDAIAGKKMMAHAGGGMHSVFIHDVIHTQPEEREQWRSHGVWFHDTYAGAAVDAHTLGLLDAAAVRRVITETIADMARVPFDDAAQREARMADLKRDVDRANRLFSPADRVDL